MAQYMREPVFVFDVDRRNDAHLQRYYYQQYRTEAGELHESGCGGAMDDTKENEMLQQYARIHVLPVMLVLKKHEGHLYGVHHGDIAIRWMAEGDRGFAEANCSEHTWFEEILEHMAYSTAKLPTTNIKEDSAAADSVIIGTMEHRSRLDVVHDRLGLPRLDAVAFDLDHMETNLTQEGERLQRAAGPKIHSDVTDTTVEADADNLDRNTRFPMRAHDRVAFEPMQRILDSIGMEPELVSDTNKVRYLIQVNNQALATWRTRLPARSALAAELKGQGGIAAVVEVLLRHRRDLHQLFSYLPCPELAAKMLPVKLIQKWGELEAYDVRVDTLREVEHRDGARPAAVTLCRAWLDACTTNGGDAQDRIVAGEAHRWERVVHLCPEVIGGARPDGIPVTQWNVLHLLPYVIWMWPATPWRCMPRSHLSHHYFEQPVMQRLCANVVGRAEWAISVEIPSGLTWADRQTAMEAGLAAQQQY